jgi:hypothetical protein
MYIYTRTYTLYIHFDPEDGGSMYLRNFGESVHIHTVQRSIVRINIKNEPPWKSKTGLSDVQDRANSVSGRKLFENN